MDALRFLDENGIGYKLESGRREAVIDCPFCGKSKKLYVNVRTWLWDCKSAGCPQKSGNEYTLKKGLGLLLATPRSSKGIAPALSASEAIERERQSLFAQSLMAARGTSKPAASPTPTAPKHNNRVAQWAHDLLHAPEAKHALAYLHGRGFTNDTIKRACLGWTKTHPNASQKPKRPSRRQRKLQAANQKTAQQSGAFEDWTQGTGWIVIPTLQEWKDGAGVPESASLIKLRNCLPGADKKRRYMRCAGGKSVLYKAGAFDVEKRVIVAGGEFDALALLQLGFENVVAAPTGEGSLTDEQEAELERVEDICIALDGDEGGLAGSKRLAFLLGAHRCTIARLPAGDWNEALQAGWTKEAAQAVLDLAQSGEVEGMQDKAELRRRCLARWRGSQEELHGISTGMECIDALIGGLRGGEVIYVSGTTGAGKSTWTSFVAMNVAKQGVPTMFAPLEIGAEAQYGLHAWQYGNCDPVAADELGLLDAVLDDFDDLPLHYWYTEPPYDIEALKQTMLFAARRLRCRVIVIDHIHFLSHGKVGDKERAILDSAMNMFVSIAKAADISVVVVGHPKKIGHAYGRHRDNAIVQNDDTKGSSTLNQLADIMISVWRPRDESRETVIDEETGYCAASVIVTKARSRYAREGSAALLYDPKSCRYLDPDKI